MIFADKMILLRKKQGMSQEQLANRLGVTRQSVSKWESGASLPEIGKIIAISELFAVSVDYLVKDYLEQPVAEPSENVREVTEDTSVLEEKISSIESYLRGYEYVSRIKIGKIPLVCIRFCRIANRPVVAKGIIAIGNQAVGVVAVGGVSCGVISIGGVSFGAFALGGLSAGIAAFGAVALGILAFGAAAIGVYSAGVSAIGQEIAVGIAAVSEKTAVGKEYMAPNSLEFYPGIPKETIREFLAAHHPRLWKPLLEFLSWCGTI